MNSTNPQALKDLLAQGKRFAAHHLKDLSTEIVAWQDTGRLHDGKLCELASLLIPLDANRFMQIAEDLVKRAALDEAIASERTEQQANPWRQAVDEALIAHALDCTGPGDDPKEKVKELIEWAVTIATDPRVSETAAREQEGSATGAEPARSLVLRAVVNMLEKFPDEIVSKELFDALEAARHDLESTAAVEGGALKPCPFCGSAAAVSFGSDGEVCNVRCLHWGKGCMGDGRNCYSEKEARTAWNQRATPTTSTTGKVDHAK